MGWWRLQRWERGFVLVKVVAYKGVNFLLFSRLSLSQEGSCIILLYSTPGVQRPGQNYWLPNARPCKNWSKHFENWFKWKKTEFLYWLFVGGKRPPFPLENLYRACGGGSAGKKTQLQILTLLNIYANDSCNKKFSYNINNNIHIVEQPNLWL